MTELSNIMASVLIPVKGSPSCLPRERLVVANTPEPLNALCQSAARAERRTLPVAAGKSENGCGLVVKVVLLRD